MAKKTDNQQSQAERIGQLLADTLGAGRDDSALEDLVLETYEKLQSHADPEHWLAENRTIWENRSGDFDETPYAAELLAVIRRKGFHHMEALRRAGQSTVVYFPLCSQ